MKRIVICVFLVTSLQVVFSESKILLEAEALLSGSLETAPDVGKWETSVFVFGWINNCVMIWTACGLYCTCDCSLVNRWFQLQELWLACSQLVISSFAICRRGDSFWWSPFEQGIHGRRPPPLGRSGWSMGHLINWERRYLWWNVVKYFPNCESSL